MKRLCLLSPDIEHTRRVVNLLEEHGIPEKHIYVLAREGAEVQDLPDSGPETDDFLPAYERGVALGGVGGLVAGLFAMAFPGGLVIGGGTVLLLTLYGAGMGGLLTGLAGASFSSSRLKQFQRDIEEGKLLVMADVPADQVDHCSNLIKSVDDEIEITGIEPPAHLLP